MTKAVETNIDDFPKILQTFSFPQPSSSQSSNKFKSMSFQTDAAEIARAAKSAFEASQLAPVEERGRALHEICIQLDSAKHDILEANGEDMAVRMRPLIIC